MMGIKPMAKRLWPLALVVLVATSAAALAGSDSVARASDDPIVIGTSLPLTGQDSFTGDATKKGYTAFEKVINARGGILGRPIKFNILDDADNVSTVISDYNTLLNRDHVDFVIGTFSTRLTLPALSIVKRRNMIYIDPAGWAPQVYKLNYNLYFYAEPAPAPEFGLPFAKYVVSLPHVKRPKTVAYILTQDPFTSSTVGGIEDIFKKAGIKTVLRATYPFGATNFDPIASRVAQIRPQMVVMAGGVSDEEGVMRSLLKAGAAKDIRIMYQTNAPGDASYLKTVGKANTTGVFWPAGYTPTLKSTGNAAFVKAYESLYHAPPTALSAFAFSAGQILETALRAVGPEGIKSQTLLANWLHKHSVQTVIGKLSWDSRGTSQGIFTTGQWQNGKPQIVLPKAFATSKTILACWQENKC